MNSNIKSRYEVTNFKMSKLYADPRCIDTVCQFDINKSIPENKYEAVKKAISDYLNNEGPYKLTKEAPQQNKEAEWEILCFKHGSSDTYFSRLSSGIYKCENFTGSEDYWQETDFTANKCKTYLIHKVRRKRDNTVFTVGDKLDHSKWRPLTKGVDSVIKKFTIHDGVMFIDGIDWSTRFTTAIKLTEPQNSAQDTQKKPTIGIIPEWMWKENRVKEIEAAIKDRLDHKQPVPLPWIGEQVIIEDWLKNRKEEQLPSCHICGGETVLIRGKYPNTPERNVCAQCNTERLEQISDISSSNYGQTSKGSL